MNSRHFDTVVQSLGLSYRRAVLTALARGSLGMMLAGAAGQAVSGGVCFVRAEHRYLRLGARSRRPGQGERR